MNLLGETLAVAVPLWIQRYRERGGPSADDIQRMQAQAEDINAHGDEILYRSTKRGDTAKYFNTLAESIAVLAFAPGGITIFDHHWDAQSGWDIPSATT